MWTTVQVLENTSGTRSGTESLPEVFLHDNCEQIDYHYLFCLSHKEEMRSGTHFTQQNVLLPASTYLPYAVGSYVLQLLRVSHMGGQAY
jgi:hypothetical protein